MSEKKKKIKYIMPFEQPPLDPTIEYVMVSNIVLTGLMVFIIATSVLALFLVSNQPRPLAVPPLTQVGHYWNFLFGWLSDRLVWDGFRFISNRFTEANQMGSGGVFMLRLVAPILLGAIAGFYMAMKSIVPIKNEKHIKGKQKVEGSDAFIELKKEFEGKNIAGSGLIFAVEDPFLFKPVEQIKDKDGNKKLVYHYKEQLKRSQYIEMPEERRRSHTMVVGGSGRGKSQLILWSQVYPIYNLIQRGERYKLFIADTPKSDYSLRFSKERFIKLAPHERGSAIWDIPNDVDNYELAKAFWKGVVPPTDEPIWSEGAIILGSGNTKLLQVLAPRAWTFGMLAYSLQRNAEYMKEKLPSVSPETNNILNGSEQTLGSMMQNLSVFSANFTAIARLWDGYEEKKAVFQATAKALTFNDYIDYIAGEMKVSNIENIYTPAELDSYDNRLEIYNTDDVTDFENSVVLFKATCHYLNKKFPNGWKWEHFAELVKLNFEAFKQSISEDISNDELDRVFKEAKNTPIYWTDLCSHIVFYAKEWDKIESRPKVSIRQWILDPDPKRKVFIVKPFIENGQLTQGLIKGILYYMKSVVLGRTKDDNHNVIKNYIIIDEFQSYGKMDEFAEPAFEMFRSRAWSLTIAYQDLAQIEKWYGENFVKFLTASVGNQYYLGSNTGDTPERLSKLVGNRTINKKHTTRSISKDGISTSENWQEHEQAVMTPEEFNSGLGANPKTKTATFLYMGNRLPNAYILEIPLCYYPEKSTIDMMSFENYIKPPIPSIEKLWNGNDNEWKIPEV